MTIENNDKRLSLFLWSFLLAILTVVAMGVVQGLRWSAFWTGFTSTALTLVITIIPFVVIFLAALLWSLLWFKIFRNPKNHNWLKLAVLSPALALLAHGIFTRPTSAERFENITGVAFPEKYSDSRFYHFGGGFADHTHTFVFTTTPEETKRLIRELEVTEKDIFSNRNFDELMKQYPGGTLYHRQFENRNWYYDFITDETQTRIWISLWGI